MTITTTAQPRKNRRHDPASGERVTAHLEGLRAALACAMRHASHLEEWGDHLATRLRSGARLLVAGNGGSAAEAQHLAAELVGRYRGDREAYSAIALNAETSSLTAIGNDYGFAEVFARQVRAHARAGDVVLLISTSGASRNLIEAARAARALGATTWALTGEGPNPLTTVCDDAICIDGASPHVQESQLAAIHAICEVFDERVADSARSGS
ncbi:D-sedoheptulose-7-phosphate isomerase [Leucobacter tenebrionis]|uniref:D-sedoheptulose-7-phosphate isomerase n=1 Tax=Leucobacter tenebrionis TaxID=2873270 RepID=UPI001CA5FDD7|nr:SIS domain-containing protein [Leucobacter tenebrionis]QZY51809.1 SIS domain-containing protein [Leucobacter tenebrionis]